MLRGERLDQEQGRAGVDRIAEIKLRGGQLLQHLGAAAGVVGDDRVEVPKSTAGGIHKCGGGTDVVEVRGNVHDLTTPIAELLHQRFRATRFSTPRLLSVMRRPRMQQHRGTIGNESTGHTGTDGYLPTGTGQQDDAVAHGHRHHGSSSSACGSRSGRRAASGAIAGKA